MNRFVTALALLLATLTAHAGDAFDLSQYRGKVVVVDFWASWCVPCRQSFPWLNEMQAKYGDQGLVIIGVNVDREQGAAKRFLAEVPAHFTVVYDPDGALATRYDIPGMPTSLVFGPTGDLLATHVGFKAAAREEREAELRTHLKGVKR